MASGLKPVTAGSGREGEVGEVFSTGGSGSEGEVLGEVFVSTGGSGREGEVGEVFGSEVVDTGGGGFKKEPEILGGGGSNQDDSNSMSIELRSFHGMRAKQSFISVTKSNSCVARRKRELKSSLSTRRRMGGRWFPKAIPVF